MNDKPQLAVIGGSGLYDMTSLEDIETYEIDTPFGKPSSAITVGRLAERKIAFLARHGHGHVFSPSEVNYRANIYALKSLGVKRIISVSACGSLREEIEPGHIVIPDQLFDFTRGTRERSFFVDGIVVHVGSAEPFCPDLSSQLYDAVSDAGAIVHWGGNFITIEGPRFSTRAESHVFRSLGMHIIGMTASPEAFLAREAEMCYATMAHVTDYDVWHTIEEPVNVQMVIQTLNQNTKLAQDAIENLAKNLKEEFSCDCQTALADAIITQREKIPAQVRQKLSLLVDKYLEQ